MKKSIKQILRDHDIEDRLLRKELLRYVIDAVIKDLQLLHRNEGANLSDRNYDNITDELIDERIKELEGLKKVIMNYEDGFPSRLSSTQIDL
jgi:hypothetical protein